MSVLRQPPRQLLYILVAAICLVSAFTLNAQSVAVPVPTSESVVQNSEQTVQTTVPTVDNSIENKSVENTEVNDANKASLADSNTANTISEANESNKAIAVQVSPSQEVKIDNNPNSTVVMSEAIPESSNNKLSETISKDSNEGTNEKGLAEGAEALANANTDSASPESENKKEEPLYYFETSRSSTLAVIIVLLVFVTYYTLQAQRGREMFIRRISGLSAIEDAVGRATEMGRGVLYVPGIADMDDIQTIAGVTILGHVARKTAEYDTDLFAPMTRSFVMSVAHEVVKQAYMEKGRVDAYRSDRINYLTDDQFGYVAGVGGIMLRDKPAACFYLGTFYAESLILAETGNSIGAIQIAGTAEPSQIPFFVAACDYTLIGEELFAASAYLSKNPREVGSLKGQDMVKVVIIITIIIGTMLATLGNTKFGRQIGLDSAATTFMEYIK